MQQLILVALGGSVGAAARFGLSTVLSRNFESPFPMATVLINLSGSFAIGLLAEFFDASATPVPWRNFAAIGVLGGYTTFSTYSVEVVQLLRDGKWNVATWTILTSNGFGIVCVVLGMMLCRVVMKRFA